MKFYPKCNIEIVISISTQMQNKLTTLWATICLSNCGWFIQHYHPLHLCNTCAMPHKKAAYITITCIRIERGKSICELFICHYIIDGLFIHTIHKYFLNAIQHVFNTANVLKNSQIRTGHLVECACFLTRLSWLR